MGLDGNLFLWGLLLHCLSLDYCCVWCVLFYRRRVRYKKNTRELDIVVGGLTEGFAEGIDDGTPVEVGLVLGWLDGAAEIEGCAEGLFVTMRECGCGRCGLWVMGGFVLERTLT